MPESFQVCRVCNGDPRASLTCSACKGAGVSLATDQGYLIWTEKINANSFTSRHLRQKTNKIFHLVLTALVIFCLAIFIVEVVLLPSIVDLLTLPFWQAGHWYVTLMWLGWFLLCFLIFRLNVYGDRTKILPNWGVVPSMVEKKIVAPKAVMTTMGVEPYFQPAAWSLIEQAYHLAVNVHQSELLPAHLFAAALASPAGGIFITRLGLDTEKIRINLSALIGRGTPGDDPVLSIAAKQVLLSAYENAYQSHRRYVGTIEIFLEAFEKDPEIQNVLDAAGYPPEHVRHVAEWIRMQELLKEEHDRFIMLARLKPNTAMNRTMTAQQTKILDRFSEDLTLAARNGYIAPPIGREREIEELLRAIESGRRSVVLLAERGVGKTAIVEALARRMVEENVPKELFDKRLVAIELPQLIAAGDPALAIDRMLSLLREVGTSGNIILVVHGIEALAGGGTSGPLDLAEAFASELKKGYFIVIATTTPSAWSNYLERRSLGNLLVQVHIPELDVDAAIRVLMAKSGFIEYQNHVFFSYAAIEKSVKLAKRYLSDQHLPASALAIAREAAVVAKRERGEQSFVLAEDVARVVHDKTNIPVEAVTQDESAKLLALEDRLHDRVIGQDDAVKAVAQAMRRARAEVRGGSRPIANFLFLGPTGVGKTELSKALAAEYFGNEQAMIRLDMSEYQDRSSIARIIGDPGDERGGLLTDAVRKNPFSIVLLDELEKAHPDILTLFLQVMDDARLTDGVGRTIDFTNVVLIATSNAGSQFIQDQIKSGASVEQIKTGLLEHELKGIFRPEFLNRFDGVIVFKPLTLEDVTKIAWLMMKSIAKRLEDKGVNFHADDAAVEELAQAGFDPIYGARPLRRVIQERVENGMADLVLKGELNRRDTLFLESGSKLRVEKAKL